MKSCHGVDPGSLPGVWHADRWGATAQHCVSSGHPELDPELPGQGWPPGQLTELLQAQSGLHEWRLLLPALRAVAQRGALVLVAPPQLPNLPVLAMAGLSAANLLRVEASTPAERLWAAEQALQCRELGVLLAWLPQARSEQLRRLQLASASRSALAFVLRPESARHESSPAPLRLVVRAGLQGRGLQVEIVKRRGPHHDRALALAAALPVQAVLRRRLLPEVPHAVDRAAAPHVQHARSEVVRA